MEDAHADGAYAELHARRRAEAGEDTRPCGPRARPAQPRPDRRREAKAEKRPQAVAVAREETELKERILMLRERLGNGATKIVLCVFVGDKYGGLLETKDYKAGRGGAGEARGRKTRTPSLLKEKGTPSSEEMLRRVAAEKAERRRGGARGVADGYL